MTAPLKPFDPRTTTVGLLHTGVASLIENKPGPPARVDGLVIGAPLMTQNPPHGGEMHPDGDEILILLSGSLDLIVDEEGTERAIPLVAGQAIVVPRGVWHRTDLHEPSQLVHITPGPGGEHRPPR